MRPVCSECVQKLGHDCFDHDPNTGPGSDQCFTCLHYARYSPPELMEVSVVAEPPVPTWSSMTVIGEVVRSHQVGSTRVIDEIKVLGTVVNEPA
jgi:hypothetical protein